MRFSVDLTFKGDPPFSVPTNYRRNIASLIKEGISNSDPEMHAEYWADKKQNKAKPFTFSARIPKSREAVKNGNKMLVFDDPAVKIYFSSPDMRFIMSLYNGLLKISGKYSPFNASAEFKGFFLQRDHHVSGGSALFKILSPVVVRNVQVNAGSKKGAGYVSCKDPLFNEALAFSVKSMCDNFLESGAGVNAENIIIDASKCTPVNVYHYTEVIPCTSGCVNVSAPDDVLNLIYNCGLGARRSQGFGMVEVMG